MNDIFSIKNLISLGIVTGVLFFLWTSRGSFDDAATLKAKVQQGALLVDVRSPQEYKSAHIEGAINIPVNQVQQRLKEFGAKEQEIIVYCKSGGRSSRAQNILQTQGYQHVYNLGGIGNWPK